MALKLQQTSEYNKGADSQIQGTKQWLPVGKGGGEGQDQGKY